MLSVRLAKLQLQAFWAGYSNQLANELPTGGDDTRKKLLQAAFDNQRRRWRRKNTGDGRYVLVMGPAHKGPKRPEGCISSSLSCPQSPGDAGAVLGWRWVTSGTSHHSGAIDTKLAFSKKVFFFLLCLQGINSRFIHGTTSVSVVSSVSVWWFFFFFLMLLYVNTFFQVRF